MEDSIQASETKLYEVLRDLFGKEKAEEAVLNVKRMINTKVANETKALGNER